MKDIRYLKVTDCGPDSVFTKVHIAVKIVQFLFCAVQLSIHSVKWATSGCCLIAQIKVLAISPALRPDMPSCQSTDTVLASDFSGAKVS